MIKPEDTLVFTDLDGTLLDHETYSWSPAQPALSMLEERHVPVILVTSKTAAEVEILRRDMGNRHPYIVENGGALVLPKGYFTPEGETIVLGAAHGEILNFLADMRAQGMAFRGFSDMDAQEIAERTGLDLQSAQYAAQRTASEPLIWQDSETIKAEFAENAQAHGFKLLQGGRFLSIGGNTDKGQAAKTLANRYEQSGRKIETIIALGDSGNDAALLQIATHPVWIRKQGPSPEAGFMARARCTIKHGPAGWCAAIQELLDEHPC